MKRKQIEYLGIENPTTPNEVKVELSGLKHAISIAKELICRYEQSLSIMELELDRMEKCTKKPKE